ncbi:hypothetical protein ACIRPQ_28855 [Streptomyces sp. NPDC101213]|uniref:hypothetical protein n=1 Tax=Streptomyces sp. NPDC101213 TaxID=3366130 RepID=UPI00382AF637
MSTPVPGQRAAQRPLRAAVAVQRSVGRALNSTSSVSEVVILQTDEGWRQIVFDEETGQERLVPYEMSEESGDGR